MIRRRKTRRRACRAQFFLPEPFSVEFTIYYHRFEVTALAFNKFRLFIAG